MKERERQIGRVFDLATEKRQREIEALPFEPRMQVERILLAADKDKQRGGAQMKKRENGS